MKTILLDGTEFHFKISDLPALIHGVDHAGASLFTVTMMADLYRQGNKILFVSGYHMARDEFISQTASSDQIIHLQNEAQFPEAVSKKVTFIQKENIQLLESFVKILPDFMERVVLLKNFDLFDESVFKILNVSPHLILSGDLDRCGYTKAILKYHYQSKIYFSIPEVAQDHNIPSLPKYHGLLQGEHSHGLLTLK